MEQIGLYQMIKRLKLFFLCDDAEEIDISIIHVMESLQSYWTHPPYSSILDVPIEINWATFQLQRASNSTIIEAVPFVSSCFFQVSVVTKEIPNILLPSIVGDPRVLTRSDY